MDFRSVQSTIATDALANLAAGLVGTMPNGANSSSVARTQLTLLRGEQDTDALSRRLLVVGYREDNAAVLEFIAAAGDENIEDRISLLEKSALEGSIERDVSLRLLRHLASDVRHRQYYDVDILTVRIARSR